MMSGCLSDLSALCGLTPFDETLATEGDGDARMLAPPFLGSDLLSRDDEMVGDLTDDVHNDNVLLVLRLLKHDDVSAFADADDTVLPEDKHDVLLLLRVIGDGDDVNADLLNNLFLLLLPILLLMTRFEADFAEVDLADGRVDSLSLGDKYNLLLLLLLIWYEGDSTVGDLVWDNVDLSLLLLQNGALDGSNVGGFSLVDKDSVFVLLLFLMLLLMQRYDGDFADSFSEGDKVNVLLLLLLMWYDSDLAEGDFVEGDLAVGGGNGDSLSLGDVDVAASCRKILSLRRRYHSDDTPSTHWNQQHKYTHTSYTTDDNYTVSR